LDMLGRATRHWEGDQEGQARRVGLEGSAVACPPFPRASCQSENRQHHERSKAPGRRNRPWGISSDSRDAWPKCRSSRVLVGGWPCRRAGPESQDLICRD